MDGADAIRAIWEACGSKDSRVASIEMRSILEDNDFHVAEDVAELRIIALWHTDLVEDE